MFMVSFPSFLLAEEIFHDIPVSVVVGEVFRVSVDKETIEFGSISGEFKVIGEEEREGFYNQVSCQGNNGQPWVLKVQCTGAPRFLGDDSGRTIPIENLKWKIVGKNGAGEVIKENKFNSFKLRPEVVYISSGADNTGNPVTLQFQYSFSVPGLAPAGRYHTGIVFTMTQEP